MGFDINEKFRTILHYKDVCIISVACGDYFNRPGVPKDIEKRSRDLINRLGNEMYSTCLLKHEDVVKKWETIIKMDKKHDVTYSSDVMEEMFNEFKSAI